MAALDVFKQIARVANIDFLATEALPTLWHLALGPLLNLEQFQSFMTLIKAISARIEQEQTRKLQDLSSSSRAVGNYAAQPITNGGEVDFESLVTGRKQATTNGSAHEVDGGWDDGSPRKVADRQAMASRPANAAPAQFSWSTPAAPAAAPSTRTSAMAAAAQASRTVTPDIGVGSFATLTPSTNNVQSTNYTSQPLQPLQPQSIGSNTTSTWQQAQPSAAKPTIDWSAAATPANAWSSTTTSSQNTWTAPQSTSSYTPNSSSQTTWSTPSTLSNQFSAVKIAPPPSQGNPWETMQPQTSYGAGAGGFGQTSKQGLDKYDSLL